MKSLVYHKSLMLPVALGLVYINLQSSNIVKIRAQLKLLSKRGYSCCRCYKKYNNKSIGNSKNKPKPPLPSIIH